MTVPTLMGNFISIFKDTSLLFSVSLCELVGAMSLALSSDVNWRPFKIEAYLFITFICFIFCISRSRYSLWVEKQLSAGKARSGSSTTSQASIIKFDKVNKRYGNDFHVLHDIDFDVAKGERIVVCGHSGSGKSTLIRCINRLEEHQQGHLTVDGIELTDNVKAIDKLRKNVGMVFQQFNLFPHLTVLENLTLSPMWVGKMPKKEAEERAMQQLERVRTPSRQPNTRCNSRAASSSAWQSRAPCA
jgi:ABC-type glutathione transport system ATPase component